MKPILAYHPTICMRAGGATYKITMSVPDYQPDHEIISDMKATLNACDDQDMIYKLQDERSTSKLAKQGICNLKLCQE